MFEPTDTETFEAVADALVEISASDRIKTHILAATMDVVGVPMLSIQQYRHDMAIVELFGKRGVRFKEGAECMCGCLLGQTCACGDDAAHGDPRLGDRDA